MGPQHGVSMRTRPSSILDQPSQVPAARGSGLHLTEMTLLWLPCRCTAQCIPISEAHLAIKGLTWMV